MLVNLLKEIDYIWENFFKFKKVVKAIVLKKGLLTQNTIAISLAFNEMKIGS